MSTLEIAERWFERRRVSDDITLLWEPHVHRFIRCNIWHVRGRDADLLVDTGLGMASLKDHIADLVDKPLLSVATHYHYDHVGSLHEFDQRIIHRAEADAMADYRQGATLLVADFPKMLIDAMAMAGLPVEGDTLVSALPRPDYSLESFAIESTTPTRVVADGDVIDLGNRHFEIIHLPGHSPGSIGLWEEKSGTLFSGDAVYDGWLLDELSDSNISDYVDTMKRLRELAVRVVHGGHEPSFGRERLHEIVDDYLRRRDRPR